MIKRIKFFNRREKIKCKKCKKVANYKNLYFIFSHGFCRKCFFKKISNERINYKSI